jgi:hypothetical protein
MLRLFRRFGRDTSGSLSVEAAIMAPGLIGALFLMFTIFDIFRLDATNSKAAYTIGDLLSRETDPVDQEFIDGMKEIFDYIVLKNEATWLRVSVVRFDGDDDEMKLVWSHSSGDGVSPLTDTTFSTIEAEIPSMAEEDTVIVVETFMPYQVRVPFLKVIDSFAFKNTIITRPRFSSQLVWLAT